MSKSNFKFEGARQNRREIRKRYEIKQKHEKYAYETTEIAPKEA